VQSGPTSCVAPREDAHAAASRTTADHPSQSQRPVHHHALRRPSVCHIALVLKRCNLFLFFLAPSIRLPALPMLRCWRFPAARYKQLQRVTDHAWASFATGAERGESERAGSVSVASENDDDKRPRFAINKHNKVKLIASLHSKHDVQERLQARSHMRVPEIAVVGRTNSGKSSLINSLLAKSGLAKASSRAGKTTSINLYLINDSLILADVPGYGFEHENSTLSRKWQRVWWPLCQSYVSSTPTLRAALFLADVRGAPIEDDRRFVRALEEANVPALLILTKDDRINDRVSPEDGTPYAVHETRNYLTSRVRKALQWPEARPHIHYSTELSPPRIKLRRWIDSLHRTADAQEAASLLDRAWAQRGAQTGREGGLGAGSGKGGKETAVGRNASAGAEVGRADGAGGVAGARGSGTEE